MEIIEKQVEKTKEVPCGYWDNCEYGHGYSYGRNINGKANAGLTLGIVGTVLGGAALLSRRGGFNLFGNSGDSRGSMDANIAIATCGGVNNGYSAPTAFQAWEKGCEDTLALQKGLYDWALVQQSQRFADRQTLNSELFGLYKSQIDADFGLYKSTRDGFDTITAKHNQDAFDLYKGQRDNFDVLNAKINALETQVAVNSAVRPYQDKLIQCEIEKAFTAGINYTDRKTCKMITGQVVLPNTPTVTGFGSYCCCPSVQSTGTTA